MDYDKFQGRFAFFSAPIHNHTSFARADSVPRHEPFFLQKRKDGLDSVVGPFHGHKMAGPVKAPDNRMGRFCLKPFHCGGQKRIRRCTIENQGGLTDLRDISPDIVGTD